MVDTPQKGGSVLGVCVVLPPLPGVRVVQDLHTHLALCK